jgi:hypothetical protein
MKTPIDLFVEALSSAAAQALSQKTSAAWTVTADDKPTPRSRRRQAVDDSHGSGAFPG